MIRLTILYNLPPDADEAAFLEWRLGEHQASNVGMPGVVQGDFARISAGWPNDVTPAYRFMTTVDWPDWESFRADFYDPGAQAKLKEDVQRIRDAIFLVSEILVSDRKATPA
jgi:hypothetical protein